MDASLVYLTPSVLSQAALLTSSRVCLVFPLYDYRHSLFINTLFCVKENKKKSLWRGAGPSVYDLIEIMANLIFLFLGDIFSSRCPMIMTIKNKKPGKTFNAAAPEEDETDAE